MKVAIMGAGLSGLACAVALEQHGISPHIYESRGLAGDRFVTGELFMALTARPIQDCVSYLSNELGIHLHPVNMTRTMNMYGPSEHAVIEGTIGHTNIRGRDKNALENHLVQQLKAPIIFNSKATYEDLLPEYSHIVLATGDTYYAQRLHNYDVALSVSMKGATITGQFDPYSVSTWISNEYTPKGYGYVIPLDTTRACMVIAYPDSPEEPKVDIHELWNKFKQRVSQDMKQTFPTSDEFEINHYIIGLCKNARIGNTFFVGNNFGSVMPFLGFGQMAALMTGAFAAHDLCGKGKYEDLTAPLRQSYHNSLVLRKTMEELDNGQLDAMVKMLSTPLGNKLFNSRRIDLLKVTSFFMRPLLKMKVLV